MKYYIINKKVRLERPILTNKYNNYYHDSTREYSPPILGS